jgi:hypothetical protein
VGAVSCYQGSNPVTDEERIAIWKWAKEHGGIDAGASIEQVHKNINDFFFGGMAKDVWIHDILSGRKTPFRHIANDAWRKQYNRQAIVQQAKNLSSRAALGPIGKVVMAMRYVPRSLAVAGHGIVFPVTHAGDLLLRPASWGTFIKGALKTYRAAGSSAYAGRAVSALAHEPLYDLAIRSGVDVGPKSHPTGLISNTGNKTGYLGAAARAWDMLTVMRFELWKKQMGKYLRPDMSEAQALDIGKNLGEWANHATGSGKGPIADIGGGTLFGPKLTQAKLNRITVDPLKTAKAIFDRNATPGEKAAAWTRLSGATQYLVTTAGFLMVNQAVLQALGSKEKVNYTDPNKGDFLAFKGGGMDAYIPGLHTEIRTLAKLLNIAHLESLVPGKRKPMVQNPALRGESKFSMVAKTMGQYGMGKLEPGIQRGLEVGLGQNWIGRPLPWSKDKGTENKPRMSYGEYAGSVGPIPLEGPIGYVYDQLEKKGASAFDRTAIIKGLIIFGGGLPGFHVREEYVTKRN